MMSFTQIDRNSILHYEHIQRLKKIKLLEREERAKPPKWAEKQQLAFPTALPLSNTYVITSHNGGKPERKSRQRNCLSKGRIQVTPNK